MSKQKMQVFDPAMCCSSGVCGPNVDPKLVRFSNDLEWLQKQGVEVERFGLSSNPGAFARNDAVKKALEQGGTDCLPLIIVNDVIVHRKSYPDRDTLAQYCGIAGNAPQSDGYAKEPGIEPVVSTPACGPGCDCNAPPQSNRAKTLVSVVVLAAIVGILSYKMFFTKQADATSGIASFEMAASFGSASGQNLDSFGDLNRFAIDQDAVFVFVPNKRGEDISDRSKTAVLSAQKTLGSKGTKVGLFTLKTSSPDYAGISSQVKVPAVLVVVKGKGMSVISGEASESGILQAFVASSRASGCGGAASCAPGAPGCK